VAIDEVEDEHEAMFIRIRVRDDGEGIAPELVDRITEPFFTTKDAGKGTGLGLSMVMGFVQQSGGRFSVDSEPGRGTTIELLLPSTLQPPAEAAGRVEEEEAAPECFSVLLVDDDDAVRDSLQFLLEIAGFSVASYGSAAQFLREAPIADLSCLVVDQHMPELENSIYTSVKTGLGQAKDHVASQPGKSDEDKFRAMLQELATIFGQESDKAIDEFHSKYTQGSTDLVAYIKLLSEDKQLNDEQKLHRQMLQNFLTLAYFHDSHPGQTDHTSVENIAGKSAAVPGTR